MSKFNIPRKSATCPACGEESTHRVTFEDDEIRHLRCEFCAAVHVCRREGSFRANIQALDFADIAGAGNEEELEPYGSTNAFQPTDFFKHVAFGTGYVVAVLSPPTKMEVKFADKVRLLACGPGSGVLPVPMKAPGRQALKK